MTHKNLEVDRGDMEAQLLSLYAERERLAQALGTADADQIIAMVRSLEEQLFDLYSAKIAPSEPDDMPLASLPLPSQGSSDTGSSSPA